MTLKRQPRRKFSRSRAAKKVADRRLSHETLERRELLAAGLGMEEGPRLIAVSANSGEQFDLSGNNQLSVSPTELTMRFTGDLIDASTLAGIQFVRSGGDNKFDNDDTDPSNDNGNDIVVTPGFIGFEQDNGTNIIVARFAETLPDDLYVVQFAGYDDTNNGVVGLRDVNGNLLCPENPVDELAPTQRVKFDVEVGPRVVGVVPQPIETISGTRVQQREKIWVFFNDDPLALGTADITSGPGVNLPVVNPEFYKLIYTNDTVENTVGGVVPLPITPDSVTYSPTLNRAELIFNRDLSELPPAMANDNAGTYRLRIGSGDALPAPPTSHLAGGGSNDRFADAQNLPVVFGTGTQSVLVTEGLIQSSEPFVSQWPGSTDAVGSRDQRRDTAITGRVDTHTGINVFPYNFAGVYGNDQQGNTASNAITDAQKDRAREVLDLYSERLGVTFVETEDEGLQIVTGDLRSIVITADTGAGADTPLSIYRVNESDPSQGVLVMDAGENWFDEYGLSPDGRPSWFVEAVRGIGSLLGIGNLFELPAGVGAGGSSPDEPNSVAFSNQYYPNLPLEPSFISHSDITLGQALHRPESNDVDFYEFTSNASGRLVVETFAERLDGSSLLDTHVNVYQKIDGQYELIARNDDFYSDDSFVGIDVDLGDASEAEFIVGVSASGNENYNGEVSGSGLGGVSEGRYNMRVTFTASSGTTISDTTGTLLDGDADGRQGGDFNFWFRTARDVSAATGDQPRTIFVDKFGDDFTNDGSLNAPLRTIAAALALAEENDVVRLLPNGGVDGLIETLGDNRAYEIGRGGAGNQPLSDGAEFEVPKGVTVMIDAGAILKLQNAKISVGSDSVDEDRSKAALQVLGQPNRFEDLDGDGNATDLTYQGEVIFTSYNNEAIGFDTNPGVTTPSKGDWAGIEFRNDFDYAEGQPVWETEGIFLDYVAHANMSFGGGSVDVNDPLIINPIHLSDSRPTLIYNTITESADAAISADPNSFRETNFHAPVFQRAASFTSDYQRVGPEISGNLLLDNSFNSLFVRVETPAGGQREQLTVSGRFDDTDIVHTLSEVLEVRGQSGGPVLLEQRPNVLSTVLTSAPAGPAAAGQTGTLPTGTYNYRVTFVDELGNESLASLPTESMPASADGFLTIDNLPTAPSEYAGRRLYRLDPTAPSEVYEFVTQLDRETTTYVDNGDTRGGILRGEERPLANGVTLANGFSTGTLFPGDAYSYRFTFVDGIGGESQASVATTTFVAPTQASILLNNLPAIPAGFSRLNVYRLDPTSGEYFLVVQLDESTTSYNDDGSQLGGLLTNDGGNGTLLSPRLNAGLTIDPGTIVKLQNARIDVGFGANFYAEGVDGQEVIFTSRLDDSVGAGGTFDTNNDSIADNASPGDWAGLIFRADANASLDFVDVSHGGGTTVSGGVFKSFNPIEILQADVRIANSTIHDNASGFTTVSNRDGFGFNDDAAIFVRGSQPVILNNTIQANEGAAISINPNSLDYSDVLDAGRSTGFIDVIVTDQDNQGALIAGNKLSDNTVNALRVRSEILTTESIWDDTDIVHFVDGEITSLTHHFRSGLRLQSDPNQGLVVKFGPDGELKADGIPLDIEDRIGGTLQVIGTPGNPVILTSAADNSVGAGFSPEGRPALDTLNQGAGGPNLAVAGDWLGLTIDTFSNDRNVAHVLEAEPGAPASNGENASAGNAQFIGDLAPNENGGDENRRLGFTVRGTLADANDEDVYTFRATGGTTVYLDIDNTTLGFDSVLELVDRNDQVLASSDNSFAEATTLVTTDPNDVDQTLKNLSVASGTILHPLFLTGVGNQEGPNPLDAGMRVILPGSASTDDNEYFVRVRSAADAATGVRHTSGQYDLSVRLREADEVAGSTVQFADIRYATNAITVTGAPLHSPLTVDAQESLDYSTIIDPTPGDPQSGDEFVQETTNVGLSFANNQADRLGNLLTSDRGSLSVTGDIGNLNSFDADVRLEDVDVYQVDLFTQQIEPDVFDSENRFVTVTFDVDYADGLGRPNTSLAVYNSFGQLVLHGRDSNIADDVGRPLKSADSENLAAGSNGVLDAHIGPVELPEGTYFVVVSNASTVPQVLDQFFEPTPTDSLVRLAPINSVRRVVEDSLDGQIYTAEAPQTTFLDDNLFFNGPNLSFTGESIVPYTLDDIRLFVTLDTAISGNNNTVLASFNPFTGTMERLIGQSIQPTDDLAIRDDGELFTFGLGPGTNAQLNQGNVGNQINLSPVNGGATNVGDDALAFNRNNMAGADLEADPNGFLNVAALAFPTTPGSTIQNNPINAMSRAFILGSRSNQGRGGEIPLSLTRNLFYEYVIGNGAVTSRGSTNANTHRMFTGTVPYDTSQGPASVDREWGVVDTGFISNNGADGGNITGMSLVPGSSSELIAVTDAGGVHTFDYQENISAPFSSEAFGYQGVIPTVYHGTVTRDPVHAAQSFTTSAPQFSGMSLGPPTIEGSAYQNVLFATTIDGWLYALEIDDAQNVQPASVFANGRSAIPLTFTGDIGIGVSPHGLAFSHLEESPWHVTGDRFDNEGHGTEAPFDQSRIITNGGASLYYGFEVTGNTADNTISRADNDNRGELAPGGSHGSIISQPIDLEGYSSGDKPTLYFNYLLEVENDDDYLRAVRNQNDSFRVFGAGDDGLWELLATNNDYRELQFGDEYDNFNFSQIPVQELFDTAPGETAQWRQARVDLGPLAGNENVRIRFDFSTAGSIRLHHGSIDFVAVPGDEVIDNEELIFTVDDLAFDDPRRVVSFETIVGRDIVLPAGSALADGDQFSVTGPDGPFVVTFRTSLSIPEVPGEVLFTASDSAIDIAAAVFDVLPQTLNPSNNLDGTIDVFAASDFAALGDAQVGQSNPVHVSPVNLTGGPSVQLIIPEVEDIVDGEIIRVLPIAGVLTGVDANLDGIDDGITLLLAGFDADGDGIDRGIDADFNLGTDADGNGVIDSVDAIATTLQFVRVPTGAPGEIVFAGSDSRDDVAARVLAALPNSLTAVYDGDGRVTFLSSVEIDIQYGPSLIELESAASSTENRVTITPADGDNLQNGETLTITSNSGDAVTLTFTNDPFSAASDPVFFAAGETADIIAARLFDAIPIGFGAVLESATELSLFAESVSPSGGALDFGLSPSTLVSVPAGIDLIDGEILRIATDAGPLDILFVESAAPAPSGTVHFQAADTQADIQAALLIAIGNSIQPVDAIASGTDVLIYGIVDASSSLTATTSITSAFQSGFNVVVPDGDAMTNNDTLDVTVGGTTTTITFVLNGVAGPNQVEYLETDPASVIAQRLRSVLSGFDAVVANGAGDTVFFAADSANYAAITAQNQLSQGSAFDTFANIDIPNPEDIRNGEQVTVFTDGTQSDVITFVRRGTNVANLGTIPIYYDETDSVTEVFQQIIDEFGASDLAYVSPNSDGINFRGAGLSSIVFVATNNPEASILGTTVVDRAAVPLTVPSGARIVDGEQLTFTLKDFSTVTLTLRELPAGTGAPGELTYDSADSAADVTASLIQQLPIALQGVLQNTREILLLNVTSISTAANSSFIGFESIANATPIVIDSTMTTREVTTRLQSGFAEGFGRAVAADNVSTTSPDDYKVYGGDRIRLYNATPFSAGNFGISSYQFDAGGENATFDTTAVPGDGFGEDAPIGIATNQVTVNGASNNEVEGVYLDDFVIGFAERGEMVLNAPLNNRNFVFNPETLPDTHPAAIQPERQNEALLGGYNLEIRTSDEYGVPEDYDPINIQLDESFSQGRSFDTNDRLADGAVTIIAQPASSLTDGDFFTINDGDRQMKFEFDDDGVVSPGNVRVAFNVANSDPIIVARSIRNAINSPQVQGVLDVTAATSDSLELAFPSSDRVELFGDNISINHSGGRYLKVDLVAEETFQGRETSKQIPQVDHTQELVRYENFGSELARATVTQYTDGSVDTLVAVGKIGDEVNTGTAPGNLQDGAVILATRPEDDFDVVRIFLQEDQVVDIDVDSLGFTKEGTVETSFSDGNLLELPVITVFETRAFGDTSRVNLLAQTSTLTPSFAPGEVAPGAFMEFTAPSTGYFDVAVSSTAVVGGIGSSGDYQLTIRPHAATSDAVPGNDVIMTDFQFGIGDKNRVSPQGQIVIEGNFIRDSLVAGISATNDARGETRVNSSIAGAIAPVADALPKPGAAALLRNENTDGLIPGVVISNNVVTASGDVGIAFGGDTNADGQIAAPTLFGRIVNNTVVGIGIGDGIRISGSASPTVLNNVISFADQGLVTTADQTGEIVAGGNAFQSNTTNSTIGLGNESIIVPDSVDLFQDRARRIYIPAAGSNIIDSSFASLTDRSTYLQTVKQPLGIAPSPIIAPNLDAYGQVRVDDTTVTTPGGVGLNVFIDRGAIDRADDERPVAVLIGPQDATGFAVPGGDQDVDTSFVRLEEGVVEFFDIQLVDESGTGPDPDTVTEENVILTENGRLLVPDVDYVFGYSANNRTIRLTPTAGLWRPDAVYQIVLNNRLSLNVALPGGDGIADGDQVVVTDANGSVQTFEFDSGFSLMVPQSSLLTVTGTNADVVEGQTFTIALADGETRTLEIDSDGGVAAGNVPVLVSNAGTVTELRDAILDALNSVDLLLAPMTIAEALDLAPVAIGTSQIQLGTLAGHTLSGGFTSVELTGQSGSAGDGDLISYSLGVAGQAPTDFELTTDTLTNVTGSIPVMITRQDTPDQIAQKIASALSAADGLGLGTARAIGDGKVAVGGEVGHSLTVTPTAPDSLIASGQPGNTAGTIPIAFDPSSQFSPSSTAAALQAALQASRAASNTVAETLSPGNGQLLISSASSVQATFGGSPLSDIGNRLAAVSDLAGNPVRETRVNQETRFTIIMPEVVFDYGDAPDDGTIFAYGTLEANNGARHTVDSGRSPRLGVNLDTENDGQPDTDGDPATGGDDAPVQISAVSSAAIFSTPTPPPSSTQAVITVTNNVANGGETISVTVAGEVTTFELTLPDTNPSFGNIAVPFELGDSPTTVASNLNAALEANIPSINEAIDASIDLGTATITLTGTDDEDGVSIGTFVTDTGESLYVFTKPDATNLSSVAADDVLGFINPLDESGTTMAVNVVGSGLLDVWVDFDRNGTFEPDEQVAKNQPVAEVDDGGGVGSINLVNLPYLDSQRNATAGDTWMRVRISESGNLEPTGVSVGGEVEDYQISVRPSAPPVPQPNSYTIDEGEGTVLQATGTDINDPLQGLIVNDDNLDEQILPVRFFIVDLPEHGTLNDTTVDNEFPGSFTYVPDADYYGTDTFTYRLSTQQNADAVPADGANIATVTITVNPVNDVPAAAAATAPVTITAIEDNGEQRFDKSELLANAVGHESPNVDIDSDPDPDAPFDESNQLLEIVEIFVDGVPNAITTSRTVVTPQSGTLRTEFVGGFLQAVYYTPGGRGQVGDDNFNSDIAGILDTFRFNVQDDGKTILENGGQGPDLTPVKSVTPGVVNIFVQPSNDAPALTEDTVAIDDPDYLAYYDSISQPAPIPTEDSRDPANSPLIIPAAFLLGNDQSGPASAIDEVNFTNGNDGPLRITDVSLVRPELGQIELLANGNISFVPAQHVFGAIEFVYTAQDTGVDRDAMGVATLRPESSSVTSTIVVEPTNDAPVAYDRSLSVLESVEPAPPAVLPITRAQLINGAGTTRDIVGTDIVVASGAAIVDGETLTIRTADGLQTVVEFSTSNVASVGTDVLIQYALTDTADDIATGLRDALRAEGIGGTATGDTVSFTTVTSISTRLNTTDVEATASDITVVDGILLTGGDTVTVTDATGRVQVFEFSETGFSVDNADVLVPYGDADDNVAVAASLRAALASAGIGSAIQAGGPGESVVQFLSLSVAIDDMDSEITQLSGVLTLPAGADFTNGETLTITDSNGTISTIEFNTTGVPTNASNLVVTIADTDTADTVATNLVAALQGQFYGATSSGAEVTLHTVSDAVAAPPVSSILTTSSSLEIPAGRSLIDGETVTLANSSGSPFVIEFNTTGTLATGSDVAVRYAPGDIAQSIATQLAAALRVNGFGATATGATVDFATVNTVAAEELAAATGDFVETLASPFNEDDQTLEVVRFVTDLDTVDVAVDGNGTHTLRTVRGGVLTVQFQNDAFVAGFYTPPVDYNQQDPFDPNDLFEYVVEDSDGGQTVVAGTTRSVDLPAVRSVFPGTVTITVTPANDKPTFTTPGTIDILEDSRDGGANATGFTQPNVIQNILPSMATALDEIQNQTVSFEVLSSVSTPSGLMTADPDILPDGSLVFYPAQDAVGSVTYVIRGTDSGSLGVTGDENFEDATIVVNVRPVNDAPRFDTNFVGNPGDDLVMDSVGSPVDEANSIGPDRAYVIGREVDPNTNQITMAPITYTVREDGTLPVGSTNPDGSERTSEPFFIPFRQDPDAIGYKIPGLLDVFVAGPGNELDGTDGGSQTLTFFNSLPATTTFGGRLASASRDGQLGIEYTPPVNYNKLIGGPDSFVYTVRDESSVGGETYDLGSQSLVDDRLTATNTIFFDLNPVNDRPEFTLVDNQPEVPEGAGAVVIPNFATNINAGPPTSAFDEVDVITGQEVRFSLPLKTAPETASQQFFVDLPRISADGTLTFEALPDVFGVFTFTAFLTDLGPGNETRGDLITSLPQEMTLTIQPQNDPPVLDTDAEPLVFSLNEDGAIEIPVGDAATPGLLTPFLTGPANEGEDLDPGGNQNVFLATPITRSTAEGGTLEQVPDGNGGIRGLLYTPRENFVGTDSFIYTVTDDGISIDIGTSGAIQSDPKFASNIVTIEVAPINDEPLFSGANNVTVDEHLVGVLGPDPTTTTIPGWVTNIQPGPPTAADEASSQTVSFNIVQVDGNPDLLVAPPTVSPVGSTRDLRFQLTPSENGFAVFTVTAMDTGLNGGVVNHDNVSDPKTFTIRVNAINDQPSFDNNGLVPIDERTSEGTSNEPYSEQWATNISPGPADEELQTVRFDVVTPAAQLNVFQTAPTIDSNGILRFATNLNANGRVDLIVRAIDSASPTLTATPGDPVFNVQTPSAVQTDITIVDGAAAGGETLDVNVDGTLRRFELTLPDVAPTGSNIAVPFTLSDSAQTIASNLDAAIRSSTLPRIGDGINLTLDQVAATLRLEVIDGVSDPETLTIVIAEVNTRPIAISDNLTTDEDTVFVFSSAQLLENDVDFDLATNPNEELRVQLASATSLSGATLTYDADSRNIEYDPTASRQLQAIPEGGSITDTFSYSVFDTAGQESDRVTVSVLVDGINDRPTLANDTPTLNPNGTTTIRPLDNDFDIDGQIDPTSIEITLQPAFGSLSIGNDGVIIYTPFGNFSTEDTFRYTVADNLGLRSEQATVTVAANAAPIALDDSASTVRDESIVINVAANDSDPDRADGAPNRGLDLGSIVFVSLPGRGQVVRDGNGNVTYTPEAGFVGPDQFQYVIADTEGRVSEAATVDVFVSQSRQQNPVRFEDVNADGSVSPLDALLVINLLADQGGDITIADAAPAIFRDDQGKQLFHNADGNDIISPNDILTVINQLAEQAAADRGQGELISAIIPTSAEQNDDSPVQVDAALFDNEVGTRVTGPAPTVSSAGPNDTDLLDVIADRNDDQDEEERLNSLDAAFGDLI